MAFRSDTGLSRPTLTALLASVMSDEPIGLLVKVIWSNDAATMAGFRLLPLTAASSALATLSACVLLAAMKLLASIWALSRSVMTVGLALMNDWVATSSVVTNWPCGHS